MARFEKEGYCPENWVPKTWDEQTSKVLHQLWKPIASSIVYEMQDNRNCKPEIEACDEIFSKDTIASTLLRAITKQNTTPWKIKVHQLHNGASNCQKSTDIIKIINEAINPELITKAGSNFIIIITDNDYGLDLWVWDLRIII